MSTKSLEVTKSAISSVDSNGMCQMLDMQLSADEHGIIKTKLGDDVNVEIDLNTRQVRASGPTQPQVLRNYNVGHPQRSGQTTEIRLPPIATNISQVRVSFNLDMFTIPFPDGQSHLTIRANETQETVTLS